MQGVNAAARMRAAVRALDIARALCGKAALHEWRLAIRRLWGLS